jgi:hypothetical protein
VSRSRPLPNPDGLTFAVSNRWPNLFPCLNSSAPFVRFLRDSTGPCSCSSDVVDLSPSLCDMARKRFTRLGWKNVKVICQDARAFRLHEHEPQAHQRKAMISRGQVVRDLDENADAGGAELVTMSYALSMIPEFYPVIDSISSLLSSSGIVGVIDFYVQSRVEFNRRNYTGGAINRHCMWISRVFWRTWFEIDRVNLEAARRVGIAAIRVQLGLMEFRTTSNTALAPSSASMLATISLASGCHTTSGSAAQRTAVLRRRSSLRLMLLQPSLLTCPLLTSELDLYLRMSNSDPKPTNQLS